MRKARVSLDLVGKYVGKTVYSEAHRTPLVCKGAVLTLTTLRALMRRGIQGIWITDEVFADLEVQELVRHETLEQARGTLQDLLKTLGSGSKANSDQARRLVRAVRGIVDEIVQNEDIVANITHLRSWDNYTFEHSIQVALLAVIIGKQMLMTEDQLLRLGTGAILHDIGKIVVPREVLQKPDRLTAEEFEIVKLHPRAGWDLVHDGFHNIMPTSSIVVLQHHERLDGSGYPAGLRGDEIYIFSKITAVADVFDAIRAERNYRAMYSPSKVLRIMQDESGYRLDGASVQVLLKHVAIVPQGEIVRLTNGLLGVVVTANASAPLQPLVALTADDRDEPIEQVEVDLQGTDIWIDRILDDWPPELLEKLGAQQRSRILRG